MRVHWTQNAIDHLVGIYEHIAINSPLYAKGLIGKLTRRSEQIAQFPFSGRKVPQYDAEDVRESSKHHTASSTGKAGSNRRDRRCPLRTVIAW
jgi:plasmid stabilization system protein ParE